MDSIHARWFARPSLGHLGERGGCVLLTQHAVRHVPVALVLPRDRLGDRARLLGGRLAARLQDLRDHPCPDRPDETVLGPDPADDRLEPDARPLGDLAERDLVEGCSTKSASPARMIRSVFASAAFARSRWT